VVINLTESRWRPEGKRGSNARNRWLSPWQVLRRSPDMHSTVSHNVVKCMDTWQMAVMDRRWWRLSDRRWARGKVRRLAGLVSSPTAVMIFWPRDVIWTKMGTNHLTRSPAAGWAVDLIFVRLLYNGKPHSVGLTARFAEQKSPFPCNDLTICL
jgi:hypothetical protein